MAFHHRCRGFCLHGFSGFRNWKEKEISLYLKNRTFELVLTVEDPAEFPTSLDESKILYTASNVYSGDSNTQFTFKINATDDVGKNNDWIRLVLKVTEGDTVSYYTIKPIVPAHTGDWYACAEPITLNGVKYEMAICWSSFFFQIK